MKTIIPTQYEFRHNHVIIFAILVKGVARGGPMGPGPPKSKWCFIILG